jgi:hypothetical protein
MQRPAAVTTFGILNIVFAVLGVIGLFGTIAMFSLADTSNNPAIKIMRENPAYAAWLKLSIPLGLLGCAALLTAGIGLLRMHNSGRVLSICYAVYAVVVGALGMVLNLVWVFRPLLEQASQKQGPEAAGAIGGAVGGSIGGCFGLAYPILLLVFMLRPKIIAAFRPADEPPAMPPV